MTEHPLLRADEILKTLLDHQVRFVLIGGKRAAGRPKDRIEFEILGALREELDRRDA